MILSIVNSTGFTIIFGFAAVAVPYRGPPEEPVAGAEDSVFETCGRLVVGVDGEKFSFKFSRSHPIRSWARCPTSFCDPATAVGKNFATIFNRCGLERLTGFIFIEAIFLHADWIFPCRSSAAGDCI